MSTRRPPRVHAQVGPITGATMIHLQSGSCYLAGGCQVCGDAHRLPEGVLAFDYAQDLWLRNRDAIRTDWIRALDDMAGPSMPCFAESLFEDAVMPTLDRRWPDRVQAEYRGIVGAVRRVLERERGQ